jgi:ferredoxin-NADP reductase
MSQLRLTVLETRAETDRIVTLALAAPDGAPLPGFTAGSHIRIDLPDGGDRTYSLVSADAATDTTVGVPAYRLGVQLEPESRGGSRYMHGLVAGDTLVASHPKNDFPVRDHASAAILIAGGIGVTPMVSMAAELRRAGRPFVFHYTGRSRELMAFVAEIEAVGADAVRIYCDDDPERRLDLAATIAASPADAHIYVCGPRGMIEAAREIAHEYGFSKDRVHFELFTQHDHLAGDQPFEVEVASSGQVFVVAADQSIIDALEAGGLDLLYDCRRGDCGICQTQVIAGTPDHRDVILTDEERASNSVMQICVSRAKTPRLVLDL